MSTGSLAQEIYDSSQDRSPNSRHAAADVHFAAEQGATMPAKRVLVLRSSAEELSPWSCSMAKRLFDCVCVLIMLPLLLPILLIVAFAVWATSSGPVFFLQKRVGRGGRAFTILKFRTIVHNAQARYHAVTTAENQPFTPVGPVLRRLKLDELPQVFNVLLGQMSLVGPRPKMPEHVTTDLCCRPGITGAATVAFACEEAVLDRIPRHRLNAVYHEKILPAKQRLDAEYMKRATFASDLRLIAISILRRWDGWVADELLECVRAEAEIDQRPLAASVAENC